MFTLPIAFVDKNFDKNFDRCGSEQLLMVKLKIRQD